MMKVYDLNQLSNELVAIKSKNKKIVHCHGVFDLLHIGHIKYFQEAKSMGYILVVTVTPDKFVNKGPGRPVFSEDLRVEVIAALDVVDYVAINKWPTAIETIKLLKPDIYVKGPDYKEYKNDITGDIKLEEEAIKSVGCKIAFTSNITFSSSKLINQNFSKLSGEQKRFLEKLRENYDFREIAKYIDELKKLKVLLVGEVIIDEYVFCNTVGKSGKEPILINHKLNSEKYAGGIIAVANHVSDFCREAKILSYLGDRDEHEKFIKDKLKYNIQIDCIKKSNSPTILKTRFVDNYTKTKILGVYDINDELLNKSEEADFCSKLADNLDIYDIVIVVDYGHGLITPKVVKLLEKKSKYLAINTQINAFNIMFHGIYKYSRTNYVCIHERELRHDYRNRHDSTQYLTRNLYEKLIAETIVITRGNKGSIAYENNKFSKCPAYAKKVVDRIGSGDTLFAITSLCFAAGIPTNLSLFIGNLAAGETVGSMGTGTNLKKINLLKCIDTLLK